MAVADVVKAAIEQAKAVALSNLPDHEAGVEPHVKREAGRAARNVEQDLVAACADEVAAAIGPDVKKAAAKAQKEAAKAGA